MNVSQGGADQFYYFFYGHASVLSPWEFKFNKDYKITQPEFFQNIQSFK